MFHHWLSIAMTLDYLGLIALSDPCYYSSIANEKLTVCVFYVYVLMCGDTYPGNDCLSEGPIVVVTVSSIDRMSMLCNKPPYNSNRGSGLACHSLRMNASLMNGDV